ncbi:universal stress protein [Natrinema thermotolerans]|uniref:Universal stress protein n=1 Tax=Natrinema thermotolerans TaxID=121872 RepID=A0AAF0PE55_9EURY|nr:universal stress protein [Natrinema thermotolerans]QCC57735.1 universal stress protein [Natrinema thermotolerans]WMT08819.1 universal stress protein [Natrinema thermotolerans]
MYDSILVATDGSEAAATAVDHAVALADRFDAALFGVAVVDERTDYDTGIVDPGEARQHLEERAAGWLTDLETRAREDGIEAETAVRSGVPHEEILAYADEVGADPIVVGSRGRSSFKGALLGSTVDRVVRTTARSVLVVGGGEDADRTADDPTRGADGERT